MSVPHYIINQSRSLILFEENCGLCYNGFTVDNDYYRSGIMGTGSKSTALLSYIRELVKLRSECIIDIRKQVWHRYLDEFPNKETEWIQSYSPLSDKEKILTDGSRVLITYSNPQFEECVPPSNDLLKWLNEGWNNFEQNATIKERIQVIQVKVSGLEESSESDEQWIYLTDQPEVAEEFPIWNKTREIWQKRQFRIQTMRKYFNELFIQYSSISSNTSAQPVEFVLGQGIFVVNQTEGIFNHPVLLRKVSLVFNSEKNIIHLVDGESNIELYSTFLQRIETGNPNALKLHTDMLEQDEHNEYHPLGDEAVRFVKSLANSLDTNTHVIVWDKNTEKINVTDDLTLILRPVLFTRKRTANMVGVIENIIQQISDGREPPKAIGGIIGESNNPGILSGQAINVLSQNAANNQISSDEILLTKEYNEEQIDIAQRIESDDGVLVQGPPGTGKTHTIANLLGHFLSQGKRVLVTSQRDKALEVLKEKLPDELQPLCLSVMADSSKDMQKSVEIINEKLGMINAISDYLHNVDDGYELRNDTLVKLADIRQKLRIMRNREQEKIIYMGEGYLPSDMGKFVHLHQELLGLIPGDCSSDSPFPLTIDELDELYKTNEEISTDEEDYLSSGTPDIYDLLKPLQFEKSIGIMKQLEEELHNALSSMPANFDLTCWSAANDSEKQKYTSALKELEKLLDTFPVLQKWMQQAVVQINRGAIYRNEWMELKKAVYDVKNTEEIWYPHNTTSIIDSNPSCNWDIRIQNLQDMRCFLLEKKKLTFLSLLKHSEWKDELKSIKINQQNIETLQDCELAIIWAQYVKAKNKLVELWERLLEPVGIIVPDVKSITEAGFQLIEKIDACLQYSNHYNHVCTLVKECGIQLHLYDLPNVITEEVVNKAEKTMDFLGNFVFTGLIYWKYENEKAAINKIQNAFTLSKNAPLGKSINDAITNRNLEAYTNTYNLICQTNAKREVYKRRHILIEKLRISAYEWAEAIKQRIEIHGMPYPPSEITTAWKCKQFEKILKDLYSQNTDQLMTEEERLRKLLFKQTESLAANSAWAKVLIRIGAVSSTKKALINWALTIKKIGKGQGKMAGYWQKIAQKYLKECSSAIPAWIMPIYKIPEIISPIIGDFDVVIVDEASQSDVSVLPILFLAKKIIIVGDDEQVSPSSIGVNQTAINALVDQYIGGIIPGAEIFDLKTSLYDIARSSFSPLMLREHFRCVPDIIGYSNMLSYDWKITPLRDARSTLLQPAMIAYRVNGIREGKKNKAEAEAIVNLVEACIAQPEYAGKTFGVITLLGDEQAELINGLILERIGTQEYDYRKVLCGNASNFQGDERDVVFLTMVDSGDGQHPLTLQREGAGNATKQRYNVAVSRARDQLWLVHSLNKETDLQQDDIRYGLIDYAENPQAYCQQIKKVELLSDSPFEIGVATALIQAGYKITQQYPVGAYHIDIVAHSGKNMVAIECDGDRYHSGEALERDIQRQRILERLGWRFIRIKGGTYFRDPVSEMKNVFEILSDYGIYPEKDDKPLEVIESTLLWKVKNFHGSTTIQSVSQSYTSMLNDKKDKNVCADISEIEPDNSRQLTGMSTSLENSKGDTIISDMQSTTIIDERPYRGHKKQVATHQVVAQSTLLPDKEILRQNEQPAFWQVVDSTDKTKLNTAYEQLLNLLKESNLEYVDNKKESGIIWVMKGEEVLMFIDKVKSTLNLSCTFESRGAKATKNKSAWRIMIS